MSAGEESDIQELVSAYAEPFACASALGMLRVSRAVAQSAKVLLTGDGGDDVFWDTPNSAICGLPKISPPCCLPRQQTAGMECDQDSHASVRSAALRVSSTMRRAVWESLSTATMDFLLSVPRGTWTQTPGFSTNLNEIPISIDAGRRVLHDFLDYHTQNSIRR